VLTRLRSFLGPHGRLVAAVWGPAGTVTAIYQTGSPELATHWLRDVAPPISSLVDAQPPEVQQRVWAKITQAWTPYTTADGSVRLENQAVWVTGTRYDIVSLLALLAG
jgi:hypothetical protein